MGVQDLTAVALSITYDPTVVEAVEVSPGSLLTLDGAAVGAERGLETGRAATFRRGTGAAGSGVARVGDLPRDPGRIVPHPDRDHAGHDRRQRRRRRRRPGADHRSMKRAIFLAAAAAFVAACGEAYLTAPPGSP